MSRAVIELRRIMGTVPPDFILLAVLLAALLWGWT